MAINCKFCNKEINFKFFDYGDIPLVNSLLKSEEDFKEEKKYPLDLYYCENCGLVQIGTTIDPSKLFEEYLYFSSTSKAFVSHGEKLVENIKTRFNLDQNSFIVEIASNDGCILEFFKKANIPHLGVEPAKNIAKVANENGINTENKFFDLETGEFIKNKYGAADIIYGLNVFAHIPKIHGFIEGLKRLIKQKGIIIFECPYLVDFITKNEFDTVYHEHVSYLSLRAVKNLFSNFGMEIIDVEWQNMHGGSLRYFIANKSEYDISKNVEKYLKLEEDHLLDRKEIYIKFGKNIEKIKKDLVDFLEKLKKENKKIVVYGAAAKGAILLNYCNIGKNLIDYVVDKSPHKQGLFIPGVHLPIYSPEKLISDKPDYALLLTWNFADEILLEQETFRKKGGKFIIPIPEIKVI
jgi:hypothetical protein